MAASTTLLTNAAALNTPTAATKTKAASQSIDYIGMVSAAAEALTQAKRSLALLAAASDASDPQLTTINNMLLTLS